LPFGRLRADHRASALNISALWIRLFGCTAKLAKTIHLVKSGLFDMLSNDIMLHKDWTNLYNEYRGQWVALQDDETTVITSGATLKEVLVEAKKLGYSDPIVHRVPEKITAFIGSNQ